MLQVIGFDIGVKADVIDVCRQRVNKVECLGVLVLHGFDESSIVDPAAHNCGSSRARLDAEALLGRDLA